MNSMEHSQAKPSLIGIFTSPIVQLQRIKEQPKVLIPLFVVLIISLIASALIAFLPDYSSLMQTAQTAMEEESMQIEMTETMEMMTRITMFLGGFFMPVILAVIPAFIYWIAAKVMGQMVTYKQLISMMLYVSLISAVGALFNSIVVVSLGLDPTAMVTGLGMFFESTDPLGVLFSVIDIFTIWYIILSALGLRYVASFNQGAAWVLPIAIVIVPTLFSFLAL